MAASEQGVLVREPLWSRGFILICLSNLAILANIHVIMPTIPLYVNQLGGNDKAVGLVVGVFTITAMLVRPVSGMLLDRAGRKIVLFTGILLAAVISESYNFADTVVLLLCVRFFHGAAFSFGHTAAGTFASDILPPRRLGEGMGYYSLASSVSMAIAPAFGLWLAGRSGFPSLFAFSAALALIAFLMAFMATSGAAANKIVQPAVKREKLGLWDFVEGKALLASVVMGLLTMLFGAVVSILVLFADENGIDSVGLFFTANAVAMIMSRPFATRWCDKNGSDGLFLAGVFLLAVCALIITSATGIAHFIIAGIAYGLGFGFCIPVLQTLAVCDVLPQRRGTAMGTFYAAFDLGIGLGAITWGWVAAMAGYRGAFLLNLAPVLFAGLVYYIAYMRKRRPGRTGL
jgi:MFS family permease